MSDLHSALKNVNINPHCGKIDLYNHIERVKKHAKKWLEPLGKNGYEHSERLELYLNSLTKRLRNESGITADEIFILLYAVYLHDIGYNKDGQIESSGHQKRSQEYINREPSRYLFESFPPFNGIIPKIAEAVGIVCYGHSSEVPLDDIPDIFPDSCFMSKKLNLRKIVALLRIADEADDPYIRMKNSKSSKSIRKEIPLVEIQDNTIIWYWNQTNENDSLKFEELVQIKLKLLDTSIQYLRSIGAGEWFIVLSPQIFRVIPDMSKNVVCSFVGREGDLEKLHEKIQRCPSSCTGIIGIGGIGKTELAKAYAKKYKCYYPDGIYWVSLQDSSWKIEASKIFAAISPNVHLKTFVDDAEAITYISKFFEERKKSLLIIDDVKDEKELIKSGCFTLITSRNQMILGSDYENSIFRLSGLDYQGGIELLSLIIGNDRVSADIDCAIQIIEILGGLPLAIEIAAQHIREIPDLSFSEYIGQIQNKIEDLKIDGKEKKNVRASLEISIDQLVTLPEGNKLLELFEASSICPESGFTSNLLIQIVKFKSTTKIDTMRLVSKLYERCLVEFDQISNSYYLHPLLKQIAEQRLTKNNSRKTKYIKNYCTYFLEYCHAFNENPAYLIAEKDGVWRALLLTQQMKNGNVLCQKMIADLSTPYWDLIKDNNYLSALDYLSASNLEQIEKIGEISQFSNLLKPLIDNLPELPAPAQIYVLINQAIIHHKIGENESAILLFNKSLELCKKNENARLEMIIMSNLGICYAGLNKLTDAISYYQQAYEIIQELDWVNESGALLNNLGNAYADLGNKQKALEYYEMRLEVARQVGDFQGEANALNNLGLISMEIGELMQGYSYLYDSLEITKQIGDISGEGYIVANMGIAYAAMELEDKALIFFQKSYKIAKKTNDVIAQCKSLRLIGLTLAEKGDFKNALIYSQKSLVLAKRLKDTRLEASILHGLYFIHMKNGDEKLANKYYHDAEKIFSSLKLEHMVKNMDQSKKQLRKEISRNKSNI
ncbi:tetratricopeptide repeat protein [Methanoregula sp.]|jgi:tetratricopeptide (TPR) repeat protein|uniref:tetratricopeptide repeat protein n=1 Tax=Methanoregula sp. TaxID=2052170 RepID=UPI003566D657